MSKELLTEDQLLAQLDGTIYNPLCKTAAEHIRDLEQAWKFVERVATYFDYTHDDVDEVKILHELQVEATHISGDGNG